MFSLIFNYRNYKHGGSEVTKERRRKKERKKERKRKHVCIIN